MKWRERKDEEKKNQIKIKFQIKKLNQKYDKNLKIKK